MIKLTIFLIAAIGAGAVIVYTNKQQAAQKGITNMSSYRPFSFGRPDMYPPSSHVRSINKLTGTGGPTIFNPPTIKTPGTLRTGAVATASGGGPGIGGASSRESGTGIGGKVL